MDTAPEMTASALVDLLRLLDRAGIEAWLDGGWGVDALLGTQTRPHKDVDLIVRLADVPALRELLGRRGFALREGSPPSCFVLADGAGLEVDVHPVTFDEQGNGVYRMENGQDWIYPAEGFGGQGTVAGARVRCLTPVVQVVCHAQGYSPAAKDLRDMEQLRARFGVELPPHLKPGVDIRPFAPEDEEAVVALWQRCGLTRPWNDPHKDIRRKVAVQPDLFLVAVRDGAMVGSVMAGYEGHRGWINYLAVAPEVQRMGIGRALMGRAEELLRAAGCPKINLQVRADNRAAVEFYRRLGYAPDDVLSLGKRLERDE